ncbi:MAG: NAD(P)H-dependent glycerol-3-phosphate dehydrogenase [Clostridia bacterium]|nr:NAD(P)H-dependent glycerol-3-phosphate dehydrogenase [Clostridia bacterium]
MKVSVIGCGRWGSCIAWYLSAIKQHQVVLYGRSTSSDYQRFTQTRKNEYLTLPETIQLTDDLQKAVRSDYIVVSIGAQGFRAFCRDLNAREDVTGKVFVLCMKGLESATGKRLTQIFREEIGSKAQVAIWVGPGHVQDFTHGRPSCMVIGSEDITLTKKLAGVFNSSLIRMYYGQDLIGCEIGAAAKNVMGLAAGMLDGYDCPGLKGALMARGAREISRLVRAMGGNELTPYGLSHLGDYQATLFSEYSHNRLYGEHFVRGVPMEKLAEGVDTCKALVHLSEQYDVDLPICRAVHRILFEGASAKETLQGMFDRENKFEF